MALAEAQLHFDHAKDSKIDSLDIAANIECDDCNAEASCYQAAADINMLDVNQEFIVVEQEVEIVSSDIVPEPDIGETVETYTTNNDERQLEHSPSEDGSNDGMPNPDAIGLPPEWNVAYDALGTAYYYHTVTQKVQWERPTVDVVASDRANVLDVPPPPPLSPDEDTSSLSNKQDSFTFEAISDEDIGTGLKPSNGEKRLRKSGGASKPKRPRRDSSSEDSDADHRQPHRSRSKSGSRSRSSSYHHQPRHSKSRSGSRTRSPVYEPQLIGRGRNVFRRSKSPEYRPHYHHHNHDGGRGRGFLNYRGGFQRGGFRGFYRPYIHRGGFFRGGFRGGFFRGGFHHQHHDEESNVGLKRRHSGEHHRRHSSSESDHGGKPMATKWYGRDRKSRWSTDRVPSPPPRRRSSSSDYDNQHLQSANHEEHGAITETVTKSGGNGTRWDKKPSADQWIRSFVEAEFSNSSSKTTREDEKLKSVAAPKPVIGQVVSDHSISKGDEKRVPERSLRTLVHPAVLVHDSNTQKHWWQEQTTSILVYPADDEHVAAVMQGDISVIPNFLYNPRTGNIHEIPKELDPAKVTLADFGLTPEDLIQEAPSSKPFKKRRSSSDSHGPHTPPGPPPPDEEDIALSPEPPIVKTEPEQLAASVQQSQNLEISELANSRDPRLRARAAQAAAHLGQQFLQSAPAAPVRGESGQPKLPKDPRDEQLLSMNEQVSQLMKEVEELQNKLLKDGNVDVGRSMTKDVLAKSADVCAFGNTGDSVMKTEDTGYVLPPNWNVAYDARGTPYYYHSATQTVQWQRPTGEPLRSGAALPSTSTILNHSTQLTSPVKSQLQAASHTKDQMLELRALDRFKAAVSKCVVETLKPYLNDDCTVARITNTDDFKYLARKFTHGIVEVEAELCGASLTNLKFDADVAKNAQNFVVDYMKVRGPVFVRSSRQRESAEY